MAKKTHHNSKTIFKHINHRNDVVENNNLLNEDDVIEYLTKIKQDVINKLRDQNLTEKAIKSILKQKIFEFVKDELGYKTKVISRASNIYQLASVFKLRDFASREWEYRPQFFDQEQYSYFHTESKIPIYVKGYDYQQPVYKFPNCKGNLSNVKFEYEKMENEFYTNSQDNMMFAKMMRIKYIPINAEKIEESIEEGIEIENLLDMPELYDKKIAISFCVLPSGDGTFALPLIRYDSSKLSHTNIFLADEHREENFGQIVESPHFHFQNTDDSILCLKRFSCNDRMHRYKSGRCNAIDCKHLRDYLVFIDELHNEKLLKLKSHGQSYGMPFLDIKLSGHCDCQFLSNIKAYLKNLVPDQRKLLSDVEKWIGRSYQSSYDDFGREFSYRNEDGRCMGGLILALDFINFLKTYKEEVIDTQTLGLLTEIELLAANDVINAMAGVMSVKDLKKQGVNQSDRVLLEDEYENEKS